MKKHQIFQTPILLWNVMIFVSQSNISLNILWHTIFRCVKLKSITYECASTNWIGNWEIHVLKKPFSWWLQLDICQVCFTLNSLDIAMLSHHQSFKNIKCISCMLQRIRNSQLCAIQINENKNYRIDVMLYWFYLSASTCTSVDFGCFTYQYSEDLTD